ncbi:hypothetical protein GJ496_000982 [Pomphorhynchus laevis]|nr:hypothetical protein GJ496_000982 [Pomphorhynchus laevis]
MLTDRNSRRSSCFTKGYGKFLKVGSVYKEKSSSKDVLRFFTPREVQTFNGFSKVFSISRYNLNSYTVSIVGQQC